MVENDATVGFKLALDLIVMPAIGFLACTHNNNLPELCPA